MMPNTDSTEAGGHMRGTVSGNPLRAQLAIEPHTDSNCALAEGPEMRDVVQQLRVEDDPDDGEACCSSFECHVEGTSVEGSQEGRQYHTSAVKHACICPVFASGDCISQVKRVENGRLIVVATVPDRGALRDIMRDLDAINANVDVEWLVRSDEPEATTEIDVGDITDKQRHAIETALEMGYYDSPRQTDLSTVADRLDISESAASQRLNGAETKLVQALLEDKME